MVFTMDEIMRLPSVSRFHFIECGANTGMGGATSRCRRCQYTHGMLSCSEFTGVPLRIPARDGRRRPQARKFVLAEGADGSSMTRTIPMELVKAARCWSPTARTARCCARNGYPLRLVVPGVQGVSWVKYLRRIEVGDKPTAPRTRPSTTST